MANPFTAINAALYKRTKVLITQTSTAEIAMTVAELADQIGWNQTEVMFAVLHPDSETASDLQRDIDQDGRVVRDEAWATDLPEVQLVPLVAEG